MTIGLRTPGAWAAGSTSVSPALPASPAAGDRMILFVGCKPYNATINTPTGWTLIGTQQTNGSTASGIDTGSVKWAVFYRDWQSGDAAPSVSITSGNVALARIHGFTKTASAWESATAYFGSDTSSGTGYSATAASSSGNITANDYLAHFTVIAGNNATFASPTITATSATIGTVTENPATEGTTATGNDLEASCATALVTSGTSSADAVCGWTLSVAQTGGSALVRLRESSLQALTQSSRFDNSGSFYAATATPGAVTLSQSSRFDGSNSFHAPAVSHGLTQSARVDNSAAFYSATVSHGLTQDSLFTNSNAIYSAVVSHGLEQSARFDNSSSFYAAVVTLGGTQTLLPSLVSNSNSFYAPTVTTGTVTLTQASSATNSAAFYSATVNHGLVQSSTATNNSSFYAATVSHGLTQASRFDNSAAFYSATVTAPGATQSLIQNAVFDDQDSFYTASVTTGPVTLSQDSLFANTSQFFGAIVDAAAQSAQATYGTLREYFGALEKNRKKLKKAKAKVKTAIKQAAQAEIEQDEPISINRIERAIQNEGIAVDEQFYVITLQILKSLEHKQIKAKIQQAIRDIEERIRQIIKAEKLKQEEDELMLIMTMI